MKTQLVDIISHFVFRSFLSFKHSREYKVLLKAADNPKDTQYQALIRILQKNAKTNFGNQYKFASIDSFDAYAKEVPIQDYEDLRELIEKQEHQRTPCLTADQPVYYQRTSGTTNAPKHIPMTAEGMNKIRSYQGLAAYRQSKTANVFKGKIFGVTGQAVEGKMQGGTPFGAASGLIYKQQSRFVRSRYVLPPIISTIEDYETRYLVMAILGAAEGNVTGVSTANPSTLIKIIEVLNRNIDVVLESILNGKLHHNIATEKEITDIVNLSLYPAKRRVQKLEKALARDGQLSYKHIWPQLAGIVTWTGGSCQIPLASLKKLVPHQTKIIELGYVASEFRGTINIGKSENLCLPTFVDNYFEFVERVAWEDDKLHFLRLDQLKENQEYYIFVTTPDGLYRYDINDIVRVNGWIRNTPAFEFVRKGKGVTNITGEKIHEDQVISAVLSASEKHGVTSTFFVMLADPEKATYRLFIELEDGYGMDLAKLSSDFDLHLRALNIEYDEKCKSGRLTSVVLDRLKVGTADEYREKLVADGQRDAQFKIQCLQYAGDCAFDFAACTIR